MDMIFDGEHFQRLILSKFDSQTEFAEKCGVSRQYISQVIKGEVTPNLRRIVQFADLLDVPVDELLGKDEALARVAA